MELSQFEEVKSGYSRVKSVLALEESYIHPSSLLNAKSISDSAVLEAKEELDHLFNKFRQGLEIIQQEIVLLSEDIQRSILFSLSKEPDAEGDAIHISEQELSQLFKIAVQILESGRIEQASCVLFVLMRLAPHNDRLWLELGSIEQRKGNFDMALSMFVQAGYLNPAHPASCLYSSDCCLLKGDLPEAKIYLDGAIFLIDTDKTFENFRPYALAISSKIASAMPQQVFHGGEK